MMDDKEFLQWIHDRLKTKYGENVNFDYMHRLREIIGSYPMKYDPNYGDDKLCKCGHTYYRHFDSYENMEDVGCKYCRCDKFEEKTITGNNKGGMMETYDRILKFSDYGEHCSTCIGSIENSSCGDWCDEIKAIECCHGHEYFANAGQLTALIKEAEKRAEDWDALITEAESGAHEWVRKNTLFVCEGAATCKHDSCLARNLHFFHEDGCDCRMPCRFNADRCKCIPYRGDKSEEKTWPGKEGKTHTEALKEVAAKEKTSSGRTGEDCSDVETIATESLIRAIEEDDKKINDKILKEIDKREGYSVICNKKQDVLKEESEMDDVEYVVLKEFRHFELAVTDIDPAVFKNISRECQNLHFCETEIMQFKGYNAERWCSELLRLGFIKKKVYDPKISLGEKYHWKKGGCEYMACRCGTNLFGLININDGNLWNAPVEVSWPIKLSDLVGKDLLSEFKPCKVEIRVVG